MTTHQGKDMNKEEKDELLLGLVDYLGARDEVFRLDGPALVTVKLHDNTFRRKTLGPEDFYVTGVYAGQRDTIFVLNKLEPDQDQDYASIEIPAKDMDTVFPMFLDSLSRWAGLNFTHDESRADPISNAESVRALLALVFEYAAADFAKCELESGDELATLPMFGMF
jgi:hypothetical protein